MVLNGEPGIIKPSKIQQRPMLFSKHTGDGTLLFTNKVHSVTHLQNFNGRQHKMQITTPLPCN